MESKMTDLEYLIKQADKLLERIFTEALNGRNEPLNLCDGAIIGLLNNLIEISKSVITLQSSVTHAGIESLLRVSFENHVYLKYITLDDTDNRARAYMLSDKLFSIRFYEMLLMNGKESRAARDFLGQSKDEIRESNTDFSNPEYIRKTTEQYLSCFNYEGKPRKWYDFDGKTNNFEELCRKVDEHTTYFMVYRIFSRETHSANASEYIQVDKENEKVALLRPLMDPKLSKNILCLFLFETISRLYEYYNMQNHKRTFYINVKRNVTL